MRRPPERCAPGHHFVQHTTEREETRTRIERLAANLFRRHVCHGPDSGSRIGDPGFRRQRRQTRGAGYGIDLGALGEAEVEQLRTARCQEDVRRLDIAMDNARPVRAVQCVHHCDADVDELRHGQRASLQTLLQRLAVEQFHHNELPAFARLADVVDRADVGMLKRRHRTRLALKSIERVRGAREDLGNYFNRHVSPKTRIACAVHLAHPADTER
jgi:hypothetical protein